MSHTTAVENIVFSDMDALSAAVSDLVAAGVKCSLEKDATPRAFFPDQPGMGKAPYVLRLHDSRFDVGFYPREGKQGYEARTDLHAGYVSKALGVPKTQTETAMQCALGKLNQSYAIHATTRAAVKKGMNVRKVSGADGAVRLVISGYK